jgi:hypothetical protein
MLAGTLVSLKFLETEQMNKQQSFLQTLNFRKNVLKQKASDKKLYIFSAVKRTKRVEELQSNLVELIEESRAPPPFRNACWNTGIIKIS